MKQVNSSKGKSIEIYDDLFDLKYRNLIYDYISTSRFKIGWSDTTISEKAQYRNLHSEYDIDDLKQIRILEKIDEVGILKGFDGLTLKRSIVNLTTPSDSHFIHTHFEKKVILYYANLEWFDGWHGETLFFEDNNREILFTSSYVPGRLIVFDGGVPHTIRPQSMIATKFRFTFALFFE
jgi:hypothetical protein